MENRSNLTQKMEKKNEKKSKFVKKISYLE